MQELPKPAPTPPMAHAQPGGPVPQYKEAVIIGNGPSGIALSYFLAGNWPYYNGHGESVNEMLHYRLLSSSFDNNNNNNEGEKPGVGKSIVEQDLRYLAQVR